MGPWRLHTTGGFYPCNRAGAGVPKTKKEEAKRANAETARDRLFIFYFERFNAHEFSRRLELRLVASLDDRRVALETAGAFYFLLLLYN